MINLEGRDDPTVLVRTPNSPKRLLSRCWNQRLRRVFVDHWLAHQYFEKTRRSNVGLFGSRASSFKPQAIDGWWQIQPYIIVFEKDSNLYRPCSKDLRGREVVQLPALSPTCIHRLAFEIVRDTRIMFATGCALKMIWNGQHPFLGSMPEMSCCIIHINLANYS